MSPQRIPALPGPVSRFVMTLAGLLMLLTAAGCEVYRTREFVSNGAPVGFEAWFVRPMIFAYRGSSGASTEKHAYTVIVSLSTSVPGTGGRSQLTTKHAARVESMSLVARRASGATPLSLGTVTMRNEGTTAVVVSTEDEVAIPSDVDEILLVLETEFTSLATGAIERRRLELPLKRHEDERLWLMMR